MLDPPLPSFNFSLRLDEGMAAEKLVMVSLIVLQKVTNFEKNLPTYLNLYDPLCAGRRKQIFALSHGHRKIIIVVITNVRVLYGLYSVLFIDR